MYIVYYKVVMKNGEEDSDHAEYRSREEAVEVIEHEMSGDAPLDYENIESYIYWDDEGNVWTIV